MSPGKKYRAEIEFEVPQETGNREVRGSISEWLGSGGGCRHPDDSLFDSLQRVRIISIKERRVDQ